MTTYPHAAAAALPKEGMFTWVKGAERWLDARGRKAWIVTLILAFIIAWPLGLALFVYMIWSNRMFTRSCAHKSDRSGPWGQHAHWGPHHGAGRSSGNAAFDAYKAETLRRLQQEQEAFEAFLQRLRDAKDKSEFDAFMEDRAKTNAAKAAPDAGGEGDTARSGEY